MRYIEQWSTGYMVQLIKENPDYADEKLNINENFDEN